MNAHQRDAWLAAWGACAPGLRLAPLRRWLSRLEAPGSRWEGGVCAGAGLSMLALRLVSGPSRLPVLQAVWELRRGLPRELAAFDEEGAQALRRAEKLPARRLSRRAGSFSPRRFPEPALAQALGQFAALCPVRARVIESEGARATGRWSLRLARPLPWPGFLRCDLARPFADEGPTFSLLLLDHAVSELYFDGERVWAFFGA